MEPCVPCPSAEDLSGTSDTDVDRWRVWFAFSLSSMLVISIATLLLWRAFNTEPPANPVKHIQLDRSLIMFWRTSLREGPQSHWWMNFSSEYGNLFRFFTELTHMHTHTHRCVWCKDTDLQQPLLMLQPVLSWHLLSNRLDLPPHHQWGHLPQGKWQLCT